MNLWQRIAKFFTEWDGEDMTKTMPLSVDDLRLVNSQRIMLTTLERERKEIKANAIEEFAERLQENVESFQTEINGFKADVLTLDYFVEFVYEIAEQLKGGAE